MAYSNEARKRLKYALRSKSAADNIANATAGQDDTTLHSVGTVSTTSTITAVEKGDGAMHKTIITLTNAVMTITEVDTASSAVDGAWGTLSLYAFPEGRIMILGAGMTFPTGSMTGSTGLLADCDFGIGLGTTARTQQADFEVGGTIAAEDNIIASINTFDLVGSSSASIEAETSVVPTIVDGTASAAGIHLNFTAVQETDVTASGTLTISGTITVLWTALDDD